MPCSTASKRANRRKNIASAAEMEIRTAASSDIPHLVALLQQLFAIEEDFSFNGELQQQGLERLLASATGTVLVAETDMIVGMASGQIVISSAEGRASLWVEDLVVDRDHRRRGAANLLLEEIGRWGRRRGARRMQLLADRSNEEALEFYRRRGWGATNLICLRKYMEENDDSHTDT